MTAPHFFLPSVDAEMLVVDGEDARHAIKSLRIREGETITISDGAGSVATCRVASVDATVKAEVLDRRFDEQDAPRLTVYQGLPKTGKIDDVVRVLTQAGVDEIVPLRSRRSIARWDERKAGAATARLRSIAREAAMQSRRSWLPVVGDLAGPADVPPGSIVLHEEANVRLRDVLPAEAPASLGLVVGPEGGLDPEEVAAYEEGGCRIASMGPTVFRTEVAGFAAAILVLARYVRLG